MGLQYYIGCSGWWYKDWDERFYPTGLSESKRLPFYSKYFNTTEVNVTFYRVPPRSTVESWVRRTPKNFIFSVKIPKEITHGTHMLYAERLINKFLDTINPLQKHNKLGALLFQLPPDFTKTRGTFQRLKDFIDKLPKTYEYSVEFRHKSWLSDEVFKLLEEYEIAYVIVDEPLLPPIVKVTADFAYIRFHGHGRKVWYYYNYTRQQLEKWCGIIRKEIEPSVSRLYIYFNNHFRAFAPKNAQEFIQLLGISRREMGLKPIQRSLEEY